MVRIQIDQEFGSGHFDEVTYADGTICISQDTRTTNLYIQNIEQVGLEYGTKLNKTKCELLRQKTTLTYISQTKRRSRKRQKSNTSAAS